MNRRDPRYTSDRDGLLRVSVEVKLMVGVLFSGGGQRSGWCQDALLRPVLCHADQPRGKIGQCCPDRDSVREGEVKESVLNFWQTAGSKLTLFEEQTINSFM